ncbi:phosphotransferase [Knoellia sp. CPCC 206453]|uniref:phosphotransferase n=1 Tax=Knoellia pratensis TaxID=3404796 RepID=UPI00361FC421
MPDSLSGSLADRLSPAQRELVGEWLPDAEFVRDHSWGLIGTVVLEAVVGGDTVIIKAADESDGHLARELRAHREWLGPWVAVDRAPRILHADDEVKVLVTQFLPGELVQDRDAEHEPDTYRQAGALLELLHGQLEVVDEGYWRREQLSALGWLDKPHRIEADVEVRLRDIVKSWPTPASVVVPTHGDWQPRNWVIHDGVVSAIDFGRAALRPAYTDFARLAAQQFLQDPRLEEAFLEGYGSDPRDPQGWQRQRIREAVGTAVWAHQVGDVDFEAQGHRMLAAALDDEGKLA